MIPTSDTTTILTSNTNLQTIKDLILIFGSLTTIILAFYGLEKWKREHKGKLRYEFSRDLLKVIYTIRDQFKGVRGSFIYASEFMPNYDPRGKNNEAENYRFIFENRLKPLSESINRFLSMLPEVEIEYSKEIRVLCDDILRQIQLYKMRLNEYIQLTGNTNNMDYYGEVSNIIFDSGKDNKTTKEFENAIHTIEVELIKKIKKY